MCAGDPGGDVRPACQSRCCCCCCSTGLLCASGAVRVRLSASTDTTHSWLWVRELASCTATVLPLSQHCTSAFQTQKQGAALRKRWKGEERERGGERERLRERSRERERCDEGAQDARLERGNAQDANATKFPKEESDDVAISSCFFCFFLFGLFYYHTHTHTHTHTDHARL